MYILLVNEVICGQFLETSETLVGLFRIAAKKDQGTMFLGYHCF